MTEAQDPRDPNLPEWVINEQEQSEDPQANSSEDASEDQQPDPASDQAD